MAEKQTFFVRIAGLTVEMHSDFEYSKRFCADFLTDDKNADIVAFPMEGKRRNEKKEAQFSEAYCENIALYRSIAEQMPMFDRIVFHGAAVKAFGKGFVFTAPPGTGKSTHIGLLMKYFGDEVSIINGDKPIIGISEGKATVYSCPWAGKEGWKTNTCATIGGIVILHRAEKNSIKRIDPSDYFKELIRQVYIPEEQTAMLKTLELIDSLSKCVPFYLLECNMTEDAAKTSYEIMKS